MNYQKKGVKGKKWYLFELITHCDHQQTLPGNFQTVVVCLSICLRNGSFKSSQNEMTEKIKNKIKKLPTRRCLSCQQYRRKQPSIKLRNHVIYYYMNRPVFKYLKFQLLKQNVRPIKCYIPKKKTFNFDLEISFATKNSIRDECCCQYQTSLDANKMKFLFTEIQRGGRICLILEKTKKGKGYKYPAGAVLFSNFKKSASVNKETKN